MPTKPPPVKARHRASHPATIRPESHQPSVPWLSPRPVLVAEHARTAGSNAGPCGVCGWALLPGDRICDLPAGQATIHVSCASTATRTSQ